MRSPGARRQPRRADLAGYDLVVCNFASFIRQWRDRGWRADYFFPSHDPEMDAYAARAERCIDVSFVGSYSRHHQRRAKVLTAVAQLSARYNVRFHLNTSRVTNIAEHPLASFSPDRSLSASSADPGAHASAGVRTQAL